MRAFIFSAVRVGLGGRYIKEAKQRMRVQNNGDPARVFEGVLSKIA